MLAVHEECDGSRKNLVLSRIYGKYQPLAILEILGCLKCQK